MKISLFFIFFGSFISLLYAEKETAWIPANRKLTAACEWNDKGAALTVKCSPENKSEQISVTATAYDGKGNSIAFITGVPDKELSLPVAKDRAALLEIEARNQDGLLLGRQIINLMDTRTGPPVTIAIAGIGDYTPTDRNRSQILSLRDSIAAELVKNYNCIVLNRSNGLALADENSLNRIAELNHGDKPATDDIPAADYLISGYYQTNLSDKSAKEKLEEGTLLIHDLRSMKEYNFKKITVQRKSGAIDPGKFAEAVAVGLGLPAKKETPPQNINSKETWMVVPFTEYRNKPGFKSSRNNDIAITIEASLQNSAAGFRLVDHNEIDKILKEAKLNALDFSKEELASGLSRLVGADKVITGQIYPADKKDFIKIDILLIDAKHSVILDSASAFCRKKDLDSTAVSLTEIMIRESQQSPVLKKASPEQLAKESDIYRELIENAQNHQNSNYSSWLNIFENTGSAFLVSKDNPEKSYKLASSMLNTNITGMTASGKDPGIRFAETAERLLRPLKPSAEMPNVFLYRANWRVILNYQNEEALKLLREHAEHYPHLTPFFMHHIAARCYVNLKQYENAAKEIEICAQDPAGGKGIMHWKILIYNKLGDEKKELAALKTKAERDDYLTYMNAVRLMKLMSKHEGADKSIRFAEIYFSPYNYTSPEVQLEIAKASLAAGNKKKAAIIAGQLEKLPDNKKRYMIDKTEYEKELAELIRSNGTEKMLWEKAKAGNTIPEKYKFYIQPVGNVNDSLIEKAAKVTADFYNVSVVILPTVPAPTDPGTFKKNRGQYDAANVLARTRAAIPIAHDAIYLALVTDKDIYSDYRQSNVVLYCASYGRIVSYFRFIPNSEENHIVELLAKGIIAGFQYQYLCVLQPLPANLNRRKIGKLCRNPECLLAGCCSRDLIEKRRMEFCNDCMDDYKKVDFDKVHFVTQHMYIPEEAESDEEASWIEDYVKQAWLAVKDKTNKLINPDSK